MELANYKINVSNIHYQYEHHGSASKESEESVFEQNSVHESILGWHSCLADTGLVSHIFLAFYLLSRLAGLLLGCTTELLC